MGITISENIYLEEDKYVLKKDEKVFGEFESEETAEVLEKILDDVSWNISYFKDNNVSLQNNKFYVFIREQDKIAFIDVFDSREEAEKAVKKEEVTQIQEIGTEIINLNNIRQENGEYVVFNDNAIFGAFESEEVAEIVYNLLKDHNWNEKFFVDYNVFPINGVIYGFVLNKDNVIHVGSFADFKEAKSTINDYLVENDLIDEGQDLSNIKTDKGKYAVFDKSIVFGTFESEEMAIVVRDLLKKHNWNSKFFNDYNVFQVNGIVYLFVLENDKIKSLGTFENIFNAKVELKKYQDKHTPKETPREILKETPKHSEDMENIKKIGNLFMVFAGTKDLGTFTSKKVAILVRNVLRKNYWNASAFVNDPIIQYEEKYYVFKVSNSKVSLYNTYKYKSAAENAVKSLYRAPRNNRSVKEPEDVDEYNYLYFIDNRFHIKKSPSSNTYGYFDTIDQAVVARNQLVKNDFRVHVFKTKNIIPFKSRYYAYKLSCGKIYSLGSFNTRNEALKVVNDNSNNHRVDNYIFDEGNKYIVRKEAGGPEYGIFNIEGEAKFAMDLLMEQNWNLAHFRWNNIFKKGEKYYVYVLSYNVLRCLGSFISLAAARKKLNEYNGRRGEFDDLFDSLTDNIFNR